MSDSSSGQVFVLFAAATVTGLVMWSRNARRKKLKEALKRGASHGRRKTADAAARRYLRLAQEAVAKVEQTLAGVKLGQIKASAGEIKTMLAVADSYFDKAGTVDDQWSLETADAARALRRAWRDVKNEAVEYLAAKQLAKRKYSALDEERVRAVFERDLLAGVSSRPFAVVGLAAQEAGVPHDYALKIAYVMAKEHPDRLVVEDNEGSMLLRQREAL